MKILLIFPVLLGLAHSLKLSCEFYDAACVEKAKENGESDKKCHGIQECSDSNSVCYVVWQHGKNGSDTTHKSGHDVKLMGCIAEHGRSCSDECQTDDARAKHFVCCCKTDLCNSNFKTVPKPDPVIEEIPKDDTQEDEGTNQTPWLIVCAIIFILIILVLLGFAGWFWQNRQKPLHFEQVPPVDIETGLTLNSGSEGDIHLPPNANVELVCVIGKGKYGQVWKGRMGDKFIALKIFPLQGKQSWMAEKEIYNLPQMDNHDNILKFLGVDQKHDNLEAEFWLATEYHVKGSLHDFLKANTVSWDELCKISLSIGAGLTYLHEEIPENDKDGLKPAIAHRDFKSKNVLIKKNMTACIADFGLALVFRPGQPIGDTHGQVGTLRYMAPEVLEGAINFSRDAFLKIDMYACGLVLWELASRCKMGSNSDQIVEEYKLPFEAEANNPNLEQMQDLVVNRKLRPTLKPSWRLHPGMSVLCDTIEECWDHDTEARLSASCVMERVRDFQRRLPIAHITDARILNNDSGVGSLASTGGETDNSSLDDRQNSADTEMTPMYILNQ